MPIYVYQIIRADGTEGETFEVEQSMKEDALKLHPVTGEPVRRVFLPPNLGTKHTVGREKGLMDNDRIAKAGFTKYEKDKVTGRYNRTAGKEGPATLDPQ